MSRFSVLGRMSVNPSSQDVFLASLTVQLLGACCFFFGVMVRFVGLQNHLFLQGEPSKKLYIVSMYSHGICTGPKVPFKHYFKVKAFKACILHGYMDPWGIREHVQQLIMKV